MAIMATVGVTVIENALFLLLLLNPILAEIQNQIQVETSEMSAPESAVAPVPEPIPVATCKISSELLQQFKEKGKATIVVDMVKPVDEPTDDPDLPDKNAHLSRGDRTTALRASLIAKMEKSQKNVIAFLGKEKAQRLEDNNGTSFTYDTMWISNQIFVKGGDLKLARDLEKFEEISQLRHEEIFQLID